MSRLLPWKRLSDKACGEGGKMPQGVDLFTEIRKPAQFRQKPGCSLANVYNILFLNSVILFKYCTEMKMPLPDGHLGVSGKAYPQSYPQNLWVSGFSFYSNSLRLNAKVLSSIVCQAVEPA
ncbi:MAG: hypothetical protein Q8M11_03595 [Sulfuritalea sp.]|nr:hypothetical protein [Sulfuritalea sp.]MDP1981168.1 hypothetical protein [Sulfuritalea sp.]